MLRSAAPGQAERLCGRQIAQLSRQRRWGQVKQHLDWKQPTHSGAGGDWRAAGSWPGCVMEASSTREALRGLMRTWRDEEASSSTHLHTVAAILKASAEWRLFAIKPFTSFYLFFLLCNNISNFWNFCALINGSFMVSFMCCAAW